MNGQIIPGTCIAVDFWKIRGVQGQLIHFLTHLHGDHITGLTSSWSRQIYCSEFTAQFLEAHHGVSKSLMKILYVNQCTLIEVPNSSDSFSVTAYDANHCPGALMLYFEGSFGNIFHTGDFRFSTGMFESLCHLVGKIDKLYLDNTFCSPDCVFPSREECQQKITEIAKDHSDCDIIIGIRKLGKESLLGMLAVELNETIFVSPARYQIAQCIFDSNVFGVATKDQKTRISTLPVHSITRELVYKRNQVTPTIAIIPTAIFTGLSCKPFSRDPKIFVVPYSDHSSFPELVEFVRNLQPRQIFPIVTHKRGPFGKDISHRSDMSLLESHMKADEMCTQSIQSKNIGLEDGHENQSEEKCTYSSDDITNTSFNEKASVIGSACKKFLYLKPNLSSCESELAPNHSLKRKKSFPNTRKKKVAKGVIFQEDFVEPHCVSEKVSYNDNMSANEKESNPSSLPVCQRGNVEVEEQHCVSETTPCDDDNLQTDSLIGNPTVDQNKNLERPFCISQKEVLSLNSEDSFNKNNVMNSASKDELSYDNDTTESSVNSTHVNVKDEDTLPDSESYNDSIIVNLVALHEGSEDSVNQIRKDDETSCVIHSLDNSKGKEPHCVSETELSIIHSMQGNHHKVTVTGNPTLDENKKLKKTCSVSQKEVLSFNSDESFQCSSNKNDVVEDELSYDYTTENSVNVTHVNVKDKDTLPDSESYNDSIILNLVALHEGSDDSVNQIRKDDETYCHAIHSLENSEGNSLQSDLHHKGIVTGNPISDKKKKSNNEKIQCEKILPNSNSESDDDVVAENLIVLDDSIYPVTKVGETPHSHSVIHNLSNQVLSSRTGIQELESNTNDGLHSVIGESSNSQMSNSYPNKKRVNECVKVCNQQSNDYFTKPMKSSSMFTTLRSKVSGKSNGKKFSVRDLLQQGNSNTLSKFNNEREFRNALAELM